MTFERGFEPIKWQVMFYLGVAEIYMQPVEHEQRSRYVIYGSREAEVMRLIQASTRQNKLFYR
jgi:hypothetical protein